MAETSTSTSRDFTAAQRARIEYEWPLLSFHYGIPPAEIAVMPRWLRRAYINRLPQLLANEQVRAIEAASFTSMEKPGRRSVMRQLARRLGTDEQVDKPKSHKDIEEFGIGITVLDETGAEATDE